MNRPIRSTVCSFIAATTLVFTLSPPSDAAPLAKPIRSAVAGSSQPQVFTVRYVCFVAQPKKTKQVSHEEALARELKVPFALLDLQEGSRHSMDTTPEGFVNGLRTAQTDHAFQVLLSGTVTCANGSEEPAVISDGPNPNDPLRFSLSDSIFLTRNSPVMLTLHHTGKTMHIEGAGIGSEAWRDAHTDKIVIGRTYSQGVINLLDGRRMVYAFCVLPGNLDQTASAWSNAVKVLASHKTTAHSKTAAR